MLSARALQIHNNVIDTTGKHSIHEQWQAR